MIEVRPQYLVPDTNAFIDYLDSIIKIAESGRFKILVPTTGLQPPSSMTRPAFDSQL